MDECLIARMFIYTTSYGANERVSMVDITRAEPEAEI
jgi:hypothetical protein